jgi:hypothetical protein
MIRNEGIVLEESAVNKHSIPILITQQSKHLQTSNFCPLEGCNTYCHCLYSRRATFTEHRPHWKIQMAVQASLKC